MDGNRGCHVLEGRSRAVEDHDFLVGRAPGLRARHHFRELGVDPCALHQSGVHRVVQLNYYINIVAIHQHMTGECPRMLFLHYWGVGRIKAEATQELLDVMRTYLR